MTARTKVVPPPRRLPFLREAARSMPLVPGTVDDCCARLMADAGLPSQDVAREWITFLEALGLVAEADGGYHATGEDPDDAALARRFREGVFLADEAVAAVEATDGPVDATTVFDALAEAVPRWERSRHTDWEAVWRERVERRLEWAAEFGLLDRTAAGYER